MPAQDLITGKLLDRPSDALSSELDEKCDQCGTSLINRCLFCGAPVCCPKCCEEDRQLQNQLINFRKTAAERDRLRQANAELLAACEDALGHLKHIYSKGDPLIVKLCAAIAKAKS